MEIMKAKLVQPCRASSTDGKRSEIVSPPVIIDWSGSQLFLEFVAGQGSFP